jgi:hypothetical protein
MEWNMNDNGRNAIQTQGAEIDLAMLRMQVQAAVLRARQDGIKAKQRGELMEKILMYANPRLLHYISVRLREGEEVADVLVRRADELWDLIVMPLKRLSQAAKILEKVGQDRSMSVRELLIVAGLPEQKADELLGGMGSPLEVGSPSKIAIPVTPLPSEEASVEGLMQDGAGEALAAVNDVPGAVMASGPDRKALSILELLGRSGEFLVPRLVALAVDLPWAQTLAESSRRTKVYEHLATLETTALIKMHSLKLRISGRTRQGIGNRVIALTDAGRVMYREHFGSEALDLLTPFTGKYKTVEAGVFIQRVREIIESWNGRSDRRWDVQVIDAVWEPGEAFEHIPGAKRSYHAVDGSTYALPDLIVEMRHVGSRKPTLAVVEVELGAYKLPDLQAKWERAMRCYPPMQVYVVAPNNRVRDRLLGEWRRTVDLVKARYGLPHGANAAFYTPDELITAGLLSARQLTSLTYRQKTANEKGEKLQPEDAVRLPKYWNEIKSKKRQGGEG